MFRLPSVVAWALPLEKFRALATTVAVPGAFPEIVAFAATAPAGIVMLGINTSTAAELLLTSDTATPPAGAALGILTGSDVVPPSATFTAAGTDRTLFVT